MVITSKTNSVVSEAKKLKQSKYRKKEGLFLVEGVKNLADSLKNGEIVKLFKTEEEISIKADCPVYTVSQSVMRELSDTVTPQGVLGVFKIPPFKNAEISDNIIVLNGVSDPGNVGTILRTALAMGYKTVICDDKTADAYSPKVVRSAMSAIFSLNIMRTDNLKETLLEFQDKGYSVYSGSLKENSVRIDEINFDTKNIIVMGNEGSGVDYDITELSDTTYIIPMSFEIESLNVAVAAGISMYMGVKRNKE